MACIFQCGNVGNKFDFDNLLPLLGFFFVFFWLGVWESLRSGAWLGLWLWLLFGQRGMLCDPPRLWPL